jgi:hypothetical protein
MELMLRVSTLLLIVISILLLFFFPAAAGSFSAVHGPVTAMRASRIARTIHSDLVVRVREILRNIGLLLSAGALGQIFLSADSVPLPLAALRC